MELIDLDTTTIDELVLLPRVAEKNGLKIIAIRKDYGRVPLNELLRVTWFRPTKEFWELATFSKMPEDEQQFLRNKFLKELMIMSDEDSDSDVKKQPEQPDENITINPY
jgi:hypothetical protein